MAQKKRHPFSRLEDILIGALEQALAPGAAQLLSAQIAKVNKIHRNSDWTEILLYAVRLGAGRRDPEFDVPVKSELELARIRFRIDSRKAKWEARLIAVNGHLFTLVIRPSPKDIPFSENIEILDVELRDDPMDALTVSSENSSRPINLWGWVREWAEKYNGTSFSPPLPKREFQSALDKIEAHLPMEYWELLGQTNGMTLNDDVHIFGIHEVSKVELEAGDFYQPAEITGRGVVAIKRYDDTYTDDIYTIYFLSHSGGNPEPIGTSFRRAVEDLLSVSPEDSSRPVNLRGWVREWSERYNGTSLSPPLPEKEFQAALDKIEVFLPGEYSELLNQTDGMTLNDDIRIFGIYEICESHLKAGDFYQLAEITDHGVVAIRRLDETSTIYFLSYSGGDPEVLGTSFRCAIENLV